MGSDRLSKVKSTGVFQEVAVGRSLATRVADCDRLLWLSFGLPICVVPHVSTPGSGKGNDKTCSINNFVSQSQNLHWKVLTVLQDANFEIFNFYYCFTLFNREHVKSEYTVGHSIPRVTSSRSRVPGRPTTSIPPNLSKYKMAWNLLKVVVGRSGTDSGSIFKTCRILLYSISASLVVQCRTSF